MPGLFSVGQHPALQAVQAQLQPTEALFAYLDDVYLVCRPERARDVFEIVRQALWEHACGRDDYVGGVNLTTVKERDGIDRSHAV